LVRFGRRVLGQERKRRGPPSGFGAHPSERQAGRRDDLERAACELGARCPDAEPVGPPEQVPRHVVAGDVLARLALRPDEAVELAAIGGGDVAAGRAGAEPATVPVLPPRRRRFKPDVSDGLDMVETNVGGRDRLLRALLAAVLSVVAISTLRKGKRKTGLLALVGALGLGFNATTCFCGLNETLGIDTTTDE